MYLYKVLAIGLLAAALMPADVTLRYKTAIKMNPTLPAQMAEQAMKGMGDSLPPESVYQLKEGKGASGFGKLRVIIDFTNQKITLLDAEKKRKATSSSDQFMEEFAKIFSEMPAEARAALASMKSTAESRVTGRTATIQGIQAEEREVMMSVEGPAMPNVPPGPLFKLAIEFWTAKADEVLRVPALRELTGYNLWAYATMNPAGAMEKMFQQMPGMADGIGKVMKEMQAAKATILRGGFKMWMPGMVAMIKQLPPDKNPFGDKFDAESPMIEMTQELAELSTAAIPESVFAVPEGYEETPVAEMVKAMMPKPQAK